MLLNKIFAAIDKLREKAELDTNGFTPLQHDGLITVMASSHSDTADKNLVQTYPTFEDWLSTWTVSAEDKDSSLGIPNDMSLNDGLPQPELSAPGSETANLLLHVEGLKISGSQGMVAQNIGTTLKTPLHDIISQLNQEGMRF